MTAKRGAALGRPKAPTSSAAVDNGRCCNVMNDEQQSERHQRPRFPHLSHTTARIFASIFLAIAWKPGSFG
jgi:hypothetical protein